MRLMIKLLICLCLVPATTAAQEGIRKFMVGPKGDQIRIVFAVTDRSPEEHKVQSLIVDLARIKTSNEEPSSVVVELTSTVRSLPSGEIKQKDLILRWKKTGELELRCDDKWTKQDKGTAIDMIMEMTKTVVQSVPLNTRTFTDVLLSPELEQKILLAFESLNPETIPCLKGIQ